MNERTAIEWTDATWTPLRARNRLTGKVGWHCDKVSAGCANCYAERWNRARGTMLHYKPGHRDDIEIFLDEKMLTAPLKWKKPRRIFVCSMTDLFADFVTDEMIDRVFAVMALAPRHVFQVLTKRSARMRAYLTDAGAYARVLRAAEPLRAQWPELGSIPISDPHHGAFWPHVWKGVSCERQPEADERIPDLLQTPAAVRFVSLEPLLGAIDLTCIKEAIGFHFNALISKIGLSFRGVRLDWVITGGESGPRARPMHPEWVRSIRDQCQAAGVPFFFKQWGEWIGWRETGAGGWMNASKRDSHGCAKGKFLGILSKGSDALFDGKALETRSFPCGEMCVRVGERAAGRLLDGREWNEMPGGAA